MGNTPSPSPSPSAAFALLEACREGDTEWVRSHQGHVDQMVSFQRETALNQAAQQGHDAIVSILVREKGADVHLRDGKGLSPLHSAVCRGQSGTVRLLVGELGADLDSVDDWGETPLCHARTPSMVRLLVVELGADPNSGLYWGSAARGRHITAECVGALCEAGWAAGREADLCRPIVLWVGPHSQSKREWVGSRGFPV